MAHLVTLATCTLNQWALDWAGNTSRIIQSIQQAKEKGATLRVGPELEISGYGCLDHFLEGDTFLHSWEALAKIIEHPDCQGIILDIGMPVRHKNVRYNCRVIVYNKRILLIRPKRWLANTGNYREMRYFTSWLREGHVEPYYLESIVSNITGQSTVDFGDGIISTKDTCFACETCEELFTPAAPHSALGLDGVEIFTNSSGSHFELRKLKTRIDLIVEATRKSGGIYLYSNQKGCDGDRLYYDGASMIICNGDILAMGKQFSLEDVEVTTATVDLEDVRTFRASPSRGMQAQTSQKFPRIELDVRLSKRFAGMGVSEPLNPPLHTPQQEIGLGGACWLWDYLRRSHAAGFFVPLSGGIDSCATSMIVFSMCQLVQDQMKAGNLQVIKDARIIVGEPTDSEWIPKTPKELCNRIFHTCYMGSKNSSSATRQRAKELAHEIGAYHYNIDIDKITDAIIYVFESCASWKPKFKSEGGSIAENLALQNIQARTRMILAYLWAQLLPSLRQRLRERTTGGSLLVLGSANVDESLRGYLTKYDCSSADINPIGGIAKGDLRSFIEYASKKYELPILGSFINATPTAELEPITSSYVQSDEIDMGLTYDELGEYGRLRKVSKLGPWGSYCKLLSLWGKAAEHGGRAMTPRQIAEKTKLFFTKYAINRHKMTVITPSLHMCPYSPDDNRFDLRPFLYPSFEWAYRKIDGDVREREEPNPSKGEKGTADQANGDQDTVD